MKIKNLISIFVSLVICFATNNVLSQNPVTVYLEDGKSVSADNYTGGKGKITADGIDYYQKELLFVKEQNKMKIMNYKAGKLRQMKKSFVLDPSNMSDLGKIYAVKYYNTKTDPAEISNDFKILAQNPEFLRSYTDFKRKIKSSNGWAIGVSTVAAVIAVPVFISTVKQANSL